MAAKDVCAGALGGLVKAGDRVRFVRFADPKCGPPMRIGMTVTIRAIGGRPDAPFAVLVDDGDPTNADMSTNGHTFSEWLHADCFEPENGS